MKRIYTAVFIAIMAVGLLMTGCGPTPPDITGTWTSTCVPSAGTPGTYDQFTNTFTGTERVSFITSYITPDCSGDPAWEYASTSDYLIGDETSVAEVWEIDYTYTAASITLLDAAYLSGFEGIVCGLTGWVVDEPMDMLGVEGCAFDNPSDGEETLQVFKVASEGAALYVSDEINGPDTPPRNTELGDLVFEF